MQRARLQNSDTEQDNRSENLTAARLRRDVPRELRDLPRWTTWFEFQFVNRRGKQLSRKMPTVAAGIGRRAKSNDPSTWTSFERALARIGTSDVHTGLQIMLGDLDDGWCLFGVDADACRDERGRISEWALDVVQFLRRRTYGEVSPSGTGKKFFGFARIKDVEAHRRAFGITKGKWGTSYPAEGEQIGDHSCGFEVYFGKRPFTVTGRVDRKASDRVGEFAYEDLSELAELLPPTRGRDGRKRKASGQEDEGDDDRPVIQVRAGDLAITASEAEDALIKAGDTLPVFQRGGKALVRPIAWEVDGSNGRKTTTAGLHRLDLDACRDLLSQAARWCRFDARANGLRPCDPPEAVARTLLSRAGKWRLPQVVGAISTPTLRPDGSVLDQSGYDEATRLYLAPDRHFDLPPIPAKVTRAHAEDALDMLLDLLRDFPFVADVDKAVALSALISPVVRGAFAQVPLHAFTAPTAGTGKSYLADLIAAIATGRICPAISGGRSTEETEKRLTGLLLGGVSLISVDNMSIPLRGDFLCQITERPLVQVRTLGSSIMTEIETRALSVFANGNNLAIEDDLVRRTILARLDAKQEKPEEREFGFDPVKAVLADRGAYVAACMLIVRAYLDAGQPKRQPRLASYEGWSDLVRSALCWLGLPDPVESMQTVREGDPQRARLRELLALWEECFGDNARTAASVAIMLNDLEDEHRPSNRKFVDLRTALLSIAGRAGNIDSERLGYWLRSVRGRIIDGRRFATAGSAQRAVRWIVE
jgi:putative DNA primase/helicase